jgi:hypothetical protein
VTKHARQFRLELEFLRLNHQFGFKLRSISIIGSNNPIRITCSTTPSVFVIHNVAGAQNNLILQGFEFQISKDFAVHCRRKFKSVEAAHENAKDNSLPTTFVTVDVYP